MTGRSHDGLATVIGVVTLLSLLAGTGGCGGDDPAPGGPGPPVTAGTKGQGTAPVQPPAPPAWKEPLAAAVKHLDNGRLDQAGEQLEAASVLLAKAGDTPGAKKDRIGLASLQTQLASAHEADVQRLAEEKTRRRAGRLAEAADLQKSGKLDEATRALEDVLAMAPTTAQRETVRTLKTTIESHRSARRRLGSWMKLLGSKTRSEVRAAQTQLRREPETVIPLLLEAVRSTDKPVLVKNTLELLRRLRRPQVAVPAMVGVLSRTDQQVNWPDAVREISLLKDSGAGPLLLAVLVQAGSPAQRAAVLKAIARAVDPPPETLLTLLPMLHADGVELEPALRAAYSVMRRHGQDDVVALRGLPAEVSEENVALLAGLPKRLEALAALKDKKQSAVVAAARGLAVLLGSLEPAALKGIKVVNAVGEYEDGKAVAVLDGKWIAAEPATIWRHPLGRPGTIILDLGAERTVTAIRIWNFNQAGGGHRGWKEIEIFVANSRTDLTPEFSGVVPPAPGADGTPDFSTTFPIAQVRGQYVILKAKSLWTSDSYSGLSEIQVIGY